MDLAGIQRIAIAARAAFEARPRIGAGTDLANISLARFPVGACGDVCLLLADIFRDRGCFVRIVSGMRNGGTHAWLIVDGLIVDITADQFVGEGQPTVVVSERSTWHDEWAQEEQRQQAIEEYDDPWRALLLNGRDELRRRLDLSRRS